MGISILKESLGYDEKVNISAEIVFLITNFNLFLGVTAFDIYYLLPNL